MVASADQPRRVLRYQVALVRDGDGFTARCLEFGWLCAAGRDLEEPWCASATWSRWSCRAAPARGHSVPSSCPSTCQGPKSGNDSLALG